MATSKKTVKQPKWWTNSHNTVKHSTHNKMELCKILANKEYKLEMMDRDRLNNLQLN